MNIILILKNYRTFYSKIVTKLSKIWVWDPGSEIRDPEKTYSGSWIPDPGSKKQWIPDPNPQHCIPDRSRIRIIIFYHSRIPDPGVKKAPDPGFGSATLREWMITIGWSEWSSWYKLEYLLHCFFGLMVFIWIGNLKNILDQAWLLKGYDSFWAVKIWA